MDSIKTILLFFNKKNLRLYASKNLNLHLGVAGFEPATLWYGTLKWPNKIQILPICNYLHLSLMVLYKNQSQIQPLFLNQILSIENYSFWTTNTLKSFWDKLFRNPVWTFSIDSMLLLYTLPWNKNPQN